MELTKRLIDYALNLRYEEIPAAAIQAQKKSLIDLLACMSAATGLTEACRPFLELALELDGGAGRCTLLGSEKKATPILAAMSNGALSHALDFEDSHELALVHPNSVSTPALLAVAEHLGGVSGRELLTTLVISSDICCRLDLACREDLLKYGWNMPPIHGAMGAIFGLGRLLKLDADAMLDAVTLCMNSVISSGEAVNANASMLRVVRDGLAAKGAVTAALLAKNGMHARFDAPLEGGLGYFHAYARDNYDPERVLQNLGTVFEGAFISFKPWPCCRATHTSVEGLLKLMKEHQIAPEEIEEICVTMSDVGRMILEPQEIKRRPETAGTAKFSLPYVLGVAAVCGDVQLKHFTAQYLRDPAVLSVADKLTYHIDESKTKAESKDTQIAVRTARGNFRMEMHHPLGCLENPMSDADFRAKFEGCMAMAHKSYAPEQVDAIYRTLSELERLEDVRTLTALL